MNRKVSAEETKALFNFCHRHFVYHYDLQLELVDHLASAIEEQWEENPELPFKDALKFSFSKFGVTGFSKIKTQKRKELSRKYNLVLWRYLLAFFTWPKILMTLVFTLALATLFKVAVNDFVVVATYFGLFTLFIFYYYYRIFPKHFKIETVKGKKFLLLENLRNAQFMTMIFIQVPIQAFNFRNFMAVSFLQNAWGLLLISLLIVVLTLALIGQMFYVPKKIKEHFNQQFPEFAM